MSQSQEGRTANLQSHNHLDDSFDSNTHAHVRQQSSHALDNKSAHAEGEHQDTLTKCPSSDNEGPPLVGKACPAATATAPSALQTSLQTEETQQTTVTTPSSCTVLPAASSLMGTSSNSDQRQDPRSRREPKKTCVLPYVLFAIDGTWQEAKEIYKVQCCFC